MYQPNTSITHKKETFKKGNFTRTNRTSTYLCYSISYSYFVISRGMLRGRTSGLSKHDVIKGVYNNFAFRREMTYFNANIVKPVILDNKSDQEIWNSIQNSNVRSHPFVFKIIQDGDCFYTTNKLTYEQYKALLKDQSYVGCKIFVVGHMTHNPREKDHFRFENGKEAFPFSWQDSDGNPQMTSFVRYPKPIELPKSLTLKVNLQRSTFLQKEVLNNRLNLFMKDLEDNKSILDNSSQKDEVD
jgi:hypothetical protein